ncbi:putative ABC transport system permease protein [Halovenus aranensis]|uniref:Putative ABC transport system permease protein n=1 Tax=Halovenus aranensis TaxID=890420 RepID=A0A1G8XVB5_9EURY|nr:ABC transporter permease [Halovenus aranensis]SDJ94437.1 putative ABC transport system permease protein [Halovenus aranensis]
MVVSLCGIAAAIAVLVVVTALALGLSSTATVEGDNVDYWIVPETGDVASTPLPSEGPRLGSTHDIAFELQRNDRIAYITPVAIEPIQLTSATSGNETYVLALGVLPADQQQSVVGADVSQLNATYPHYANGSYNGVWTGELLASPAAAAQLDVDAGETLRTGQANQSFTVQDVTDSEVTVGVSQVPVVITHLAELQTLAGLADGDLADQILVATNDDTVRETLTGVYPNTEVVTRAGLGQIDPTPTSLPFAMALTAGITSLGIGALFVATMMGLELNASRQRLAVLSAIGFSRLSISLVLVAETVTVAVLGGVIGTGLGLGCVVGLNAGLAEMIGLPAVAVLDSVLVVYGIVTAAVVGLLATGYPLYIARRTTVLEELTQ